jgi:hypothetical protein
MNMFVSHVINPATLDNEFKTLVEYVEYKLLKWDNKKLETQQWEEHEKKFATYVENKMQDFDGVVDLEVEQRKWGWHPLFSHLHDNSIIMGPCPHLSLDTQQRGENHMWWSL